MSKYSHTHNGIRSHKRSRSHSPIRHEFSSSYHSSSSTTTNHQFSRRHSRNSSHHSSSSDHHPSTSRHRSNHSSSSSRISSPRKQVSPKASLSAASIHPDRLRMIARSHKRNHSQISNSVSNNDDDDDDDNDDMITHTSSCTSAIIHRNGNAMINDTHHSTANTVPTLHSISRAKVISIRDYGAFVSLVGTQWQALLHISQISQHRVDCVGDVIEVGEELFVKVSDIKQNNGRTQLSVSMKFIDQTTGEDKDVNNIEWSQSQQRRRHVSSHSSSKPLAPADAIIDTVCSRCGIHGHASTACFVPDGANYSLLSFDSDFVTPEDIENIKNKKKQEKLQRKLMRKQEKHDKKQAKKDAKRAVKRRHSDSLSPSHWRP